MAKTLKSSPIKRRRITKTQFYTPHTDELWKNLHKSNDPNAYNNAYIRIGKNFQAHHLPQYQKAQAQALSKSIDPLVSYTNTMTTHYNQCVEQWNPYRCDDDPSLVTLYLDQCHADKIGVDVPKVTIDVFTLLLPIRMIMLIL